LIHRRLHRFWRHSTGAPDEARQRQSAKADKVSHRFSSALQDWAAAPALSSAST
jgi:hypothetical protein